MAGEVHRLPPDREGRPVMRVALQALRFHPRNIRTNLGDLDGLAQSIREEGILVPLMAEKLDSGGLRLLHGHRRWAAADMAGLRRVPVVIVPPHTDDEAILLMLAENTSRAEVAAPDLRAAIVALTGEFGYSVRTVARRLGVPTATVEGWAAGVRAPHAVRPVAPVRRGPSVAFEQEKAGRASVSAQRARKHPRIRPTAVHELLVRWDAGEVDPAVLVAELRGWLGDWRPPLPKPTAGAAS